MLICIIINTLLIYFQKMDSDKSDNVPRRPTPIRTSNNLFDDDSIDDSESKHNMLTGIFLKFHIIIF